MSHTAGPWEACGNLVRTVRGPGGEGGFLIAECPANLGDRIENALLIAAAPEMLDALRQAVVTLAGVLVHAPELGVRKDYEIVSAAIAKATGSAA